MDQELGGRVANQAGACGTADGTVWSRRHSPAPTTVKLHSAVDESEEADSVCGNRAEKPVAVVARISAFSKVSACSYMMAAEFMTAPAAVSSSARWVLCQALQGVKLGALLVERLS